ncbi:mitochondrial ornithine transporter 1-like [Nilaparvata lugens]|uniref:mitochondrial ornithine transporter 1-like n=1 Tax=Nilaparvata lugens TaxID=108931 RepID=UPI000B9813A7|nr:mitochondrial ornithine transporter 1-like [Nilaparvata lugens]
MVHSKNSNTSLLDGVIDFTSGSLGAVALVYVGQPLDTVKVKMQTFPELYRGMWHCMRKTLSTEGVRRGLYAGTVPALAANVAENSVLFAAYGACQKVIAFATDTKDVQDLGVLSNASAGFLAAFFSSFSLCPTELIKIKMQAAKEHAAQTKTAVERESAFKITHKILKTEGIMGVFRGIVPTMAREMPGYFFFFGGYEATRIMLTPEGKTKDECGALRTMAAGAVGGVSFWTAVFPFDVVKSRIQVGQMSDGSMFTNMLTMFRNEGFTAMYSGWTPTVIRTIPSTAVLFLVYETSRSLLNSFLGTENIA